MKNNNGNQENEVANKAKEELTELMEELFVGKLRSSLESFVKTTGNANDVMNQKLDIHSNDLSLIQNEIGKLSIQLPEQLRPLGLLEEIKNIQMGMGKALLEKLKDTEDILKQKLHENLKETSGFARDQQNKLIETVIDNHKETIEYTSSIIHTSFGQMAVSIQTSAEHLSGESGRNQSEMQQFCEFAH